MLNLSRAFMSISAAFALLGWTAAASAQSLDMSADVGDMHLQIPGAHEDYPFVGQDITVADALRLFSRNLRIGLIIDEDFDPSAETVVRSEGSRLDYLDDLASLYDFGWYFDGSVLHVFPIGEMQIKVFPLQQTNGAELISMLKSLGVYQERFLHRTDTRRQALLVSGPDSYVETVESVVDAVEKAETNKIKVLRGTTGSVTATVLSSGGDTSTSPTPAGVSGG